MSEVTKWRKMIGYDSGNSLALPAFVAAALAYCGSGVLRCIAQEKPTPRLIILEHGWNLHYVDVICKSAQEKPDQPCPHRAEHVIAEFESPLKAAFAAESACHGLTLNEFNPEMPSGQRWFTPSMAKIDHWALVLKLDPFSASHPRGVWSMARVTGPNRHPDSMEGAFYGRIVSPEALARRICEIAKGVGGSVE